MICRIYKKSIAVEVDQNAFLDYGSHFCGSFKKAAVNCRGDEFAISKYRYV